MSLTTRQWLCVSPGTHAHFSNRYRVIREYAGRWRMESKGPDGVWKRMGHRDTVGQAKQAINKLEAYGG